MRILAKPDDMIKLDTVNGIRFFFGSFPFVADFFVFDHLFIQQIS